VVNDLFMVMQINIHNNFIVMQTLELFCIFFERMRLIKGLIALPKVLNNSKKHIDLLLLKNFQ
jgi:hypothetical protein